MHPALLRVTRLYHLLVLSVKGNSVCSSTLSACHASSLALPRCYSKELRMRELEVTGKIVVPVCPVSCNQDKTRIEVDPS